MWAFRLYEICKYKEFGRKTFLYKLGIDQKANSTNNRVYRGGNYNNNGTNNPADNRNNNNPTNINSNRRLPCSTLISIQMASFKEVVQ